MKITANFTMEEMTKCSRAGIENIPDAAATVALKNLTINVLQPIRDNFKKSVNISCAYRCTEYNKAVSGVENSQHLYGEAADITVSDVNLAEVAAWCRRNIKVDQLIHENKNGIEWIHISYRVGRLRNEYLTAKYVNGKYDYTEMM